MADGVGFDRVGHFVRLPATANGLPARFLLDSGIGLTIVSTDLAERLGLALTGDSHTGYRMSGQEVCAPLATMPLLEVAGHHVADSVVGVFDLGSTDGPGGFDGILGLDVLRHVVVEVNPATMTVEVNPDRPMPAEAAVVPVRVEEDGPSVALFARLRLPSGTVAEVEVDTGSGCLILDARFMHDCGVVEGDGTDTVVGTDETDHQFVRHFADVQGEVTLLREPDSVQDRPRAMFQDIRHDGLLGSEFLSRWVHRFDVGSRRILLASLDEKRPTMPPRGPARPMPHCVRLSATGLVGLRVRNPRA